MTIDEFCQYINDGKELYLLNHNSLNYFHILPPYRVMQSVEQSRARPGSFHLIQNMEIAVDVSGEKTWLEYHIMLGAVKCKTMINLSYLIWGADTANDDKIQYIIFTNKQSVGMYTIGFTDIRD